MRNSLEIKDEKAQLKTRACEMIDLCKKEIRDFSPEEQDEYDKIKSQIEELNRELKALEDSLENTDDDSEEEDEKEEESRKNINFIQTTMEKRFSLVKAIRNVANNKPQDELTAAVLAAGSEQVRRSGVAAQGQIQLPESRAAVTVASEGTDLVATDLFDIVTPLRARNVLVQAGARFMSGLVGNVQFPIMTASNVTWKGETAQAADGAPTFSNVTLTPHRLTAYVDISKQLLAQDSLDVENVIREDLIAAINNKLEATILGNGDGKEGGSAIIAPVGMRNGITATTVSNYAGICTLEGAIDDANVLGGCAYVISNKAKAALRAMIKGTNGTGMVYENGAIDGTIAYNTSNFGTGSSDPNSIIYGDWSNLAIGNWAGIDIVVDPYTVAISGQVRIVVNAFFDAKKLRASAFAIGTYTAPQS